MPLKRKKFKYNNIRRIVSANFQIPTLYLRGMFVHFCEYNQITPPVPVPNIEIPFDPFPYFILCTRVPLAGLWRAQSVVVGAVCYPANPQLYKNPPTSFMRKFLSTNLVDGGNKRKISIQKDQTPSPAKHLLQSIPSINEKSYFFISFDPFLSFFFAMHTFA